MVDVFLKNVVGMFLKDVSGDSLIFVQVSVCKALFSCSCSCVFGRCLKRKLIFLAVVGVFVQDVSDESLISLQLSACF